MLQGSKRQGVQAVLVSSLILVISAKICAKLACQAVDKTRQRTCPPGVSWLKQMGRVIKTPVKKAMGEDSSLLLGVAGHIQ